MEECEHEWLDVAYFVYANGDFLEDVDVVCRYCQMGARYRRGKIHPNSIDRACHITDWIPSERYKPTKKRRQEGIYNYTFSEVHNFERRPNLAKCCKATGESHRWIKTTEYVYVLGEGKGYVDVVCKNCNLGAMVNEKGKVYAGTIDLVCHETER